MTPSSLASRRWSKHVLLALFWTGAALLFVAMRYVAPLLAGADLPEWGNQRWAILGWMMWIPMTYIAIWLARLFPLNTPRWPAYAPLHVVGAIACSGVGGLLFVSLIWLFTGGEIAFGERLRATFVGAVPIDSIIYFAVLGGVYGFEYYRLHKEEQRHTEILRAELAEAQLTTLRTQLNPHFLFNALNTVSAHIRENSSEATEMVAELGDFLRAVLDLGGQHSITVDREIGTLRQYLAVQRIRFGDALEVTIDVDRKARAAQVPSLLLQPLVENAIHHGIRARLNGGHLWVIISRVEDTVRFQVLDDGPGLQPPPEGDEERDGQGLKNVHHRLKHLFSGDFRLSLARTEHQGTPVTCVTVEIPYREEPLVSPGSGDGHARPEHPPATFAVTQTPDLH